MYKRRFGGNLVDDLGSSDLESFLASLAFVRQEVQDGETVYYHMHHWHGEGSGGPAPMCLHPALFLAIPLRVSL
jgi:hypothetical protein